MLSPKLTVLAGRSREIKRSWTSLPSARSRDRLDAADEGVGNSESMGSRFGAGGPGESSFSAG
jgi:hypothetical protein